MPRFCRLHQSLNYDLAYLFMNEIALEKSGRSELGHGMNVDFVPHGFFDMRDIG